MLVLISRQGRRNPKHRLSVKQLSLNYKWEKCEMDVQMFAITERRQALVEKGEAP